MSIRKVSLFAGASLLALAGPLAAETEVQLDPVSLISDGQEDVRATGGAVITAEDLDALRPADVSELFARESAVTVSGGPGPSKRIHVFGMEQSQLAVKVDGVPQAANAWHHTGSNVIDPVFLKRVEIEAGAAAADAGFGAAAGAVRYETVSAADLLEEGRNIGGRAGLSFGSNGRGAAAHLATYGRHGALDWFVMVHGTDGDKNYKDGEGREIKGTAPGARGVLAKLGYETAEARFELGYEKSEDEADRLIKLNLYQASDTTPYPMVVSREALSFSYKALNTTALWDPELKLYVSDNGFWRPNYSPSRSNGNMILDERQTGFTAKNTFSLAKGSITAGIDHNHHKFSVDNYGVTAPRYRAFSTTQTGIFAQGRFAFDNGVDLSAGARYDGHTFKDWNNVSHKGKGLSGNATVSYRVTEMAEVFAAASSTWLGYVPGDYAYLHARDGAYAVHPDYTTGRAKNFKTGVNLNGDAWTAGVTLFDTRIAGLPNYQGRTFLENYKEMRSRGFTLHGSYQMGDTRLGASITNAKTSIEGGENKPDATGFMPIGKTASFWIDHALPQYDLKVGATLELVGSLPAVAEFQKQVGYGLVNAYAEWSPAAMKGGALRLGVENLLDKSYYDRASYGIGTRATPIYSPGRTVTLGATFRF